MDERALTFATRALKGLTNPDGTPYIEHALRVAGMMDTEFEQTVALLHDVVEDTETDLSDLANAGFSRDVRECVDQLTRKKSFSYFEYIEDIATNAAAVKVKLAEIADNQDLIRVQKMSFKTYTTRERCEKAINTLLANQPELRGWFTEQVLKKTKAKNEVRMSAKA